MAAKKKTSKKTSEIKSMEELLSAYGGKPKGLSVGQPVTGTIVEINSKKVLIDIGSKTEGVVTERAFDEAKSFIKDLNVGDKIEANVLITETPEGYTVLSLRKAAQKAIWDKLEKTKKEKKPIVVLGKATNSSGAIVDVMGINGFIPSSQIGKEASRDTSELVGKNFKVKIIDLNQSSNKVVLSEKAVSEAENIELIQKAMDEITEGKIYDGIVTTVSDFGVFVQIKSKVKGKEVPVEGLVHISEISWDKVDKPSDVLKEGGKVEVKVIGIRDGKLSLSIKNAQKDPWEDAEKKYKKDKKVTGKVSRISDFGVFVQLEPGIEGLIHLTKIPPGKKYERGQEVNCYIEETSVDSRKISLGLVLTAKPVGYK